MSWRDLALCALAVWAVIGALVTAEELVDAWRIKSVEMIIQEEP